MNHSIARQEATRVTVIGMLVDLLLGIGKIIGGTVTNSFALIADGIHSLTDAVTDVFVLLMARLANEEPDREHPYGHGRFESLGTVAMGMVFFATAGILLYDSFQRLVSPIALPVPAMGALVFAILSIASKEWVYHYTMRIARRLNSSLLKANAWHSRSDAVSSIAVLIGLIAAQQGYPWMDTVAAACVALIIGRIGWELSSDSLKELVDTAVPENRREQIEECILSTDGIMGINSLRSRLSGGKIIIELQLVVSPRISVTEGHQLGEIVSRKLQGKFSDVEDVIVHIDPIPSADATTLEYATPIPERHEILANIETQCHSLLASVHIDKLDLHYLDGGVEIDFTINTDPVDPDLGPKIVAALGELDYIKGIRIVNQIYDSTADYRQ